MNNSAQFETSELIEFLKTAANATYAGGGKREEHPERLGFIELKYTQGEFDYRDSYTGFYRSFGTETVRYQKKPIWISLYGGGMTFGNETIALPCFTFLKKALMSKGANSSLFRGPDNYTKDDWEYTYKQEGGVDQFSGYEEIEYQGKVAFTHKIIGGFVIDKK